MGIITDIISGTSISADTIYVSGNSITQSYKVYTALLTQIGTNDPSIVLVENTLGSLTITRNGVGTFDITSSGLFTVGKTTAQIGTFTINAGPAGGWSATDRIDNNTVRIYTTKFNISPYPQFSNSDNVLNNTLFEIRVYN